MAKAFSSREKVYALENIGFTLRVVSVKNIDALTEFE
jgi:hypothetical protein